MITITIVTSVILVFDAHYHFLRATVAAHWKEKVSGTVNRKGGGQITKELDHTFVIRAASTSPAVQATIL